MTVADDDDQPVIDDGSKPSKANRSTDDINTNEQGILTNIYEAPSVLDDLNIGHTGPLQERITAPNGPDLAERYSKLAKDHYSRFQQHGNLGDLYATINYLKAAIQSTPENIYGRQAEIKFLRDAMLCQLEAVSRHHPTHQPLYVVRAALYAAFYRTYGIEELIEDAVRFHVTALDSMTRGDPDLPICHACLMDAHSTLYTRFGRLQDLEFALLHSKLALEYTPVGHPSLPDLRYALALVHGNRYKRYKMYLDSVNAIKYHELALEAMPPDHPSLRNLQDVLIKTRLERNAQFREVFDLDRSIELLRQVVQNMGREGRVSLAACQEQLAICLMVTHGTLPGFGNFEEGLQFNKLALENTFGDDSKLFKRQTTLINSYSTHFSMSGSLESLRAALSCCQTAINGKPNLQELTALQNCAVTLYYQRYRQTEDLSDAEESLKLTTLLLAKTPRDHPDYSAFQLFLCKLYDERYKKLGTLDDLSKSLEHHRIVVDSTPAGHPDRITRLVALTSGYKERLQKHTSGRGGVEDCLGFILQYDKLLLDAIGRDHPNWFRLQAEVAEFYVVRYVNLGEPSHIEDAKKHYQLAVKGAPTDYPHICLWYMDLARAYKHRYEQTKHPEDYSHLRYFSDMALLPRVGHPEDLFIAATYVANYTRQHDSELFCRAAARAAELLPEVLWEGNFPSELKPHLVSFVFQLAAATAITLGNLDKAIVFFEGGRESLQPKAEGGTLSAAYPQAAAKLKHLSQDLVANKTISWEAPYPAHNTNYISKASERDSLISKIRSFDGFGDFMVSPSYKQLSEVAAFGTVIMLNYTPTKTDAIIMISPAKQPQVVPLPTFTPEIAPKWLGQLKAGLRAKEVSRPAPGGDGLKPVNNVRGIDHIGNMLSELWTVVVKPVFEFLRKNGVHGGRIWWCKTGPFAPLPIHAAAGVDSPYIQSYTPTLNELLRARGSKHTPEVKGIKPGLGTNVVQFVGSGSTVNDVLERIQTSAWLHIACRSQRDTINPLKSALMLADGRLELGQILSLNLPMAKLVFLSACETGDASLVDAQLASEFITAGFQGAIGTLWSTDDAVRSRVAERAFAEISKGGGEPDVMRAAEGLHKAVRELRRSGSPYHQWVPFVHFGV